MTILILTGPPAAGKNTISTLVAKQLSRCAVIDVDVVRWMILQPHKAPWDGEEGQIQQKLGVLNACLLTKSFTRAGFDVLILDVVTDETASMYKTELGQIELKIILLLPSFIKIKNRNASRGQRITEDEVEMLYNCQKRLSSYDDQIDNSDLTAEDVATQLVKSYFGSNRRLSS